MCVDDVGTTGVMDGVVQPGASTVGSLGADVGWSSGVTEGWTSLDAVGWSTGAVVGAGLLWWVRQIDWYHIFCKPAMANSMQRRRMRLAYRWPMWREDSTRSFPGYQLPRLPTMNGKMLTMACRCSSSCLRGSYFSTLDLAASSSALGEPSKGQDTSSVVWGYNCQVRTVVAGCARDGLLFHYRPQVFGVSPYDPLQDGIVPFPRHPQVLVAVVEDVSQRLGDSPTDST